MQSGVLSSENVADVLRGISQRRRQGILEINTNEDTLSIKFVQGRVVEAHSGSLTPIQETVERFARAGYPCTDPKTYPEGTYAELLSRFVREFTDTFDTSPTQLKNAIKQRVLDHLYRLDVGNGAFFTFKVQMIEYDRDFAPSISIGQVLLDLVELSGEREAFAARFPHDAVVRPTGSLVEGLSFEDEELLRAVGDGCSVDELERRTLLSTYHFRHSLLELSDNSLVSVSAPGASPAAASASLDVDSFLSESIDAAFGDGGAATTTTTESDTGSFEVGMLGEVVDTEGVEIDEPDAARGTFKMSLGACNARLLQNTLVPSLVALGFLLLACASPFFKWSSVVAAFADM